VEEIIKVDLSLDVREYARRVKNPALLITAMHDQIVPPVYSENLIPGAKSIELNSGHLIFLEKPVELGAAILSFCQRQAGAALEIRTSHGPGRQRQSRHARYWVKSLAHYR
jgi:hypothetical protein